MRLTTYEEASVALGKSIRTIYRMVASGELVTVIRDGRRLIELDAPDAADAADRLAQVSAAAAIQRSRDSDVMSLVIEEMKYARKISRWGAAMSCVTVAAMSTVLWVFLSEAAETHVIDVRQLATTETHLEYAVSDNQKLRDEVVDAESRADELSGNLAVAVTDMAKLETTVQHQTDQLQRAESAQAKLETEGRSLLAQLAAEKTRADYFAGGGLGPAQLASK